MMKKEVRKASVSPLTFAQTVVALQYGQTPERVVRWYVSAELPPEHHPWKFVYLRKTGEWTLAACCDGIDDPDSAYFASEQDAIEAASSSQSPEEQLGYSLMGRNKQNHRPWWKF